MKSVIEKMGFEKNKRLVMDYKNKPEWVTIGGKTFYSRSKLERTIARYLQLLKDSMQIKEWDYEMMNFKFPDDTWLVDFTIRENNDEIYYIETKGQFTSASRKKLKLLFKYYPQVRVLFVFQNKSDIRKMATAVKWCWWRKPVVLSELTRGIV